MTDDEILAGLDASIGQVTVACTDSPNPRVIPGCGKPSDVLVLSHPFGVCGGDREKMEWTTLCQFHFDELRGMCEQVRDRAARVSRGVDGPPSFVTPYLACADCGRRFSPDELLVDPKPIVGSV